MVCATFRFFNPNILPLLLTYIYHVPGNAKAKLGESNKFYYDEKLKRWVEEGADPPAEEPAIPPPPTTTTFQNGMPDYNASNAFKSENNIKDAFQRESHTDKLGPVTTPSVPLEQNSGIPPIPPSQNQFSARGRMGVRSR